MNTDLFGSCLEEHSFFVPGCKIPCCKDTIKSFAIVQMHGSWLQEEYRKGTHDASEPQASFFSAADTEATVPSFNPAFLSWICEIICIKNYNGKSKCIESEGITRWQEAYTTRTSHLDQLSASTVTKILSTEARITASLPPAPLTLPVHPNETAQNKFQAKSLGEHTLATRYWEHTPLPSVQATHVLHASFTWRQTKMDNGITQPCLQLYSILLQESENYILIGLSGYGMQQ